MKTGARIVPGRVQERRLEPGGSRARVVVVEIVADEKNLPRLAGREPNHLLKKHSRRLPVSHCRANDHPIAEGG